MWNFTKIRLVDMATIHATRRTVTLFAFLQIATKNLLCRCTRPSGPDDNADGMTSEHIFMQLTTMM
jgi:hypothetical protein